MKTIHSKLFRTAAAAVIPGLFLFLAGPDASASPSPGNSATWLQEPSNGFWNSSENWNTGTAPNGTNDTANFKLSTQTTVSLIENTSVGQIIFGSGPGGTTNINKEAPTPLPAGNAYTIQTNGHNLDLYGAGIVNNSGQAQTFINGGSVNPTILGSEAITSEGPAITFHNSASAGNALITIINQSNQSHVTFLNNSSGGQATIINANSTSYIDISELTSSGTAIGAIGGVGTIYLGSKNLAVGGNNISTVFSGVITDGSPLVEPPVVLPESRSAVRPQQTGGSLTKVGTGTLTLTGANTYTGNTYVNGGTLIVDGSIISPYTFVNQGGLLGGTGLIGGSIVNNGMVMPGDAPGTISIKGSYTQGPAGTLVIQIASTSVYDQVAVNGSATLGGTLVVDPLNGFKLKRGQTFDFFTANGGIGGQFSNLIQPSTGTLLKFGLVYEGNEILLEAEVASFSRSLQGLTPNEMAVAKELDRVVNDSRENKLINYLSTQPLGQLPGDFDKIAAEELTSIFTLGTAFDNVQSLNLQRRTSDLRSGANGFSAAGFAATGSTPSYSGGFGFAGPNGDEGKESKDLKTVAPEENRWGTFITGVGEWVGVGDDYNARGYNIETGGFTLGVDYKVCDHFAVGLMAGYVGTGVDLTDGGRVLVNGGKLGVYGTAFGGGFYTDFAATGGYSSYDTHRSALQGTARGDTDGGDLNVLLGAGYDFKAGGLTFGPTATFNYTYVGIRDFTEDGSLAPLNFGSQGQDSLRSAFGFKASYDCKVGGLVIKPEISAAWQHEYGDASYALDSSFASGAGNVFTVNGPKIGRDSALVGAGFAIQLSERASTYVYYDGELGRVRFDSQNVSGGFRLAF